MLVLLLFLLASFRPVFAASDIQITDYSVKAPEWVQISNTSSNSIDLSGWYFEDKDKNKRNLEGCISPNSKKVFGYSGFLNDTGDNLSLYDKNNNLIHDLGALTINQKDQSTGDSTCKLCTYGDWGSCNENGKQTKTSLISDCLGESVLTQSCTYDSTIINPTSGISLTEFMPYADPEWIEIYNSNDKPVKLVSWKIENNNGNTENIDNLSISAKSYGVQKLKNLMFDNNNNDRIILRDQNNVIIGNPFSYAKGLVTIEKSWSLINGNWCQSNITKGFENVTSCSSNLTPTLSPSPTPTIEPIEETPSIEPTPFIENTSTPFFTPTPDLITEDNSTTKQNFLPTILIFGGAILLLSPLIISKIKKS